MLKASGGAGVTHVGVEIFETFQGSVETLQLGFDDQELPLWWANTKRTITGE